MFQLFNVKQDDIWRFMLFETNKNVLRLTTDKEFASDIPDDSEATMLHDVIGDIGSKLFVN